MEDEHKENVVLFHVVNTQTYLLGSSHYLPPGQHHLSPAVWQIADRSKRLVFESTNPEKLAAPPILKLPDGESLEQYLPAPLFTATSALWRALFGDTELLNEYKVWAVALKLVNTITVRHSGLSRQHGVDHQLWKRAEQRGVTPRVLEGLEALRPFDDAPLPEQVEILRAVVSNPPQAIRMAQLMCSAWQKGDLGALATIQASMISAQPATFRALMFGRNKLWLPTILEHIRSGEPTLITVGILHFVGDESVPALLHEEGFQVVPVVVDDARRGVLFSLNGG
jgi:uncharacterized protein YbaP (TraB family)